MEYRAGKCSQCGAEYQIPASFAHNVARCKKCKSGVVHLSAPVRSAAAPAAPAAEPTRPAPGPSSPAEPRTTSAPRAAEATPQRPVPAPRPPATAAPVAAASADAGAKPVRAERAPVEPARRSRTPLLIGLGLVALAAALFLFRARLFGSETAGETSTPAAGAGTATDAAHGSAPPDGG